MRRRNGLYELNLLAFVYSNFKFWILEAIEFTERTELYDIEDMYIFEIRQYSQWMECKKEQ